MDISDVRKLKALESENARLKKIVADQALKVVVSKKFSRTQSSEKRWCNGQGDRDQRTPGLPALRCTPVDLSVPGKAAR